MTVSDADPNHSACVLDPRTLGRPMHLLGSFAERFGADVSELLRQGLNRRYAIGLQVVGATIRQRSRSEEPVRWNVYAAPAGRIGIAVPRALVLRLLLCRYGASEPGPLVPDTVAVTASEERLSTKLGQQLALALACRVASGLPPAGVAADALATDTAVPFHSETALPTGLWQIDLTVEEPHQGGLHVLRFSLDDGCMHALLDRLGRDRTVARDAAAVPTQPLVERLKLRLTARLVQQRLPLGAILDLQPGSVLPIPQPTAVVLVKDSPLFSASVAEHKGRLWLTAFQDL
jgi:flagellar motor switch protein FliM